MNVYSVIVCYRPEILQLSRLCVSLLDAGSKVILVDNTELPLLFGHQGILGCQLITLGYNSGIAHAQNVGIGLAIKGGANIVALFDQDSKLEQGFLSALVAPLIIGTPDIVAPLCFDDLSNAELPSVRLNRYGMSRAVHSCASSIPYSVDVVISSGIAATREVFEVAGTLDERLFIDFVDTEWCLRCRSKQIPIRVVPSAVMRHRIGSKAVKFIFITILVHSPSRCYYQIRNCFHLFRMSHIPILFAIKETTSVFFSRAILFLIVRDKVNYCKAYLSALRDGIAGITGYKPL
jgi:rhamnosyltransferase